MIKKISSLTRVFCKEYFLNLQVINKRKNILFWLIIILNIALAFISQKCIDFLGRYGQEQLFLDVLFLIINLIVITQTILSCANIFYFSKDLENVLPFPIKNIELLISKLNTVLCISYIMEIFFGIIPLLIFGLMVSHNLLYYFWAIIVLISFPIFSVLIISSIMLIIMQLFKFIKNKDFFQLLITVILVLIFILFESLSIGQLTNDNNLENNIESSIENNSEKKEEIIYTQNDQEENSKININKISEINKYFLIINPSVKILIENNNFNCLINFIKIILIELISFIIFIFIGRKIYLKNLLKNISRINTKSIQKNHRKNKYKKINKNKEYIIQEFKNLIKNPTFLVQCIFPTIIVGILIAGLIILLYPTVEEIIKTEMDMQELKIVFDIHVTLIILVIIQVIFVFSNISLTAITRKGKNAVFMKYIPINLYKQFLFINIPQIIFNNFSIIIILIVMKYFIPSISIFNILLLFILANLLNIINSFLMVTVDLKRPNLNWDNETSAIKENGNKLFQYVFTIIIVAFLLYLNKIFEGVNFYLSISIIIIIFILIIFLINLSVIKNIKKLFEKIY